ncbi:MAG: PepSY domain-containing protein [Turicibacter sp.]|nr:PepSY domain-containing protein [Turicibacter sp.]
MLNKVMGVAGAILLFSLGYLSFSFVASNVLTGAEQVAAVVPAPVQQNEADMRAEIEELRALVQILVMNLQTPAEVSQISSQHAVEIALELVGHGVASDAVLFTENDTLTFEVEVREGNIRYAVYVNAETGNPIRMNRFDDAMVALPPANEPIATPPPEVQTPTPVVQPSPIGQATPSQNAASPSPAAGGTGGGGRPSNPAISLDRAIELGHAELARRGFSGTFREHSGMDFEYGQWVWEILFSVPGGRLPLVEMYINVDTGAIVKFEWDD